MNRNWDNKERSFLAQPQANLRGQLNNGPSSSGNQEQSKVITTLRSGKVVWKESSTSTMDEDNNSNDENDEHMERWIDNEDDFDI